MTTLTDSTLYTRAELRSLAALYFTNPRGSVLSCVPAARNLAACGQACPPPAGDAMGRVLVSKNGN